MKASTNDPSIGGWINSLASRSASGPYADSHDRFGAMVHSCNAADDERRTWIVPQQIGSLALREMGGAEASPATFGAGTQCGIRGGEACH